MIDDGTYDALVIDVAARDDGVVFSLAITSGAQKGAVTDVAALGVDEEQALTRIGEPCTLVVRGGAPHLDFLDLA